MAERRFREALDSAVLLGDGAMGTELLARGVAPGACLPELNRTRPDLIRSLHREYFKAGARVHRTNTFTANRIRLAAHGLERNVRELNLAAVSLLRQEVERVGRTAGSVGPLSGTGASEDDRRRAYAEQLGALAEAGCDWLFLETFTEGAELELAARVAQGFGLPVAALATVDAQLRCRDGMDLGTAWAAAERAGASLIGINCVPVTVARKALEQSAGRERRCAFPSPGAPGRVEPPPAFAAAAGRLGDHGPFVLGGCCGAGPEHIRALGAILRRPRPSG